MNKRLLGLGILAGLLFILLIGVVSAKTYYYGYGCDYYGCRDNGYYERSSSFNSKSSGLYGGPLQFRTTSYDKVTSWNYLRDGTRQKTTTYVKVERRSPRAYSSPYAYGGGYYGDGWGRNYYQYPSYSGQYYMGSMMGSYGWDYGW